MTQQKSKFQIVIIDDDPEIRTRPLYEELVDEYQEENIIWKDTIASGLSFLRDNLGKRTIVILDYDFGLGNQNGKHVFQEIQKISSLIYIILNTAKSISDIPNDELKFFINNHLMVLVDKTDGYQKTLSEVKNAIDNLNNRLDCILEEWILRHERFARESPYIRLNGNSISLNNILQEIRNGSDLGKRISKNIIDVAISSFYKSNNKQ